MYDGKFSLRGLAGPDAVNGVLLVFCSHPVEGLNSLIVSLTGCRPFHSVAAMLPSTGCVQSNFTSRRGTKLPCQYAMLPSASAYTVLFDEFVRRSITLLNDA